MKSRSQQRGGVPRGLGAEVAKVAAIDMDVAEEPGADAESASVSARPATRATR